MIIHHKMAEMTPRQVAIVDIDESPGPYCMSFGFNLDTLIQSIRHIGLANPPILKSDPGGLTVVAGYRRIMALKALGAGAVPCRIISGHEIPPLECLLLNLYDNLSTRRLNDMEKGMALNRLDTWLPRHEIVNRYMPLLGLRPNEKGLLFFHELEKDFDVKVKTFVAEGGLSWRAVTMLSDMDAASRASLATLISYLRFNINQQIQLIDILIDLSLIEGKPIPHILSELALDNRYDGKNTNRPQQAKAVLNRLRMRRNPALVTAETRFRSMVAHLNLPEGIRIDAPAFFEGEYYRLEILFREGEDLKSRLEDLLQTGKLAQLKNPWDETVR